MLCLSILPLTIVNKQFLVNNHYMPCIFSATHCTVSCNSQSQPTHCTASLAFLPFSLPSRLVSYGQTDLKGSTCFKTVLLCYVRHVSGWMSNELHHASRAPVLGPSHWPCVSSGEKRSCRPASIIPHSLGKPWVMSRLGAACDCIVARNQTDKSD